MKKCPQCNTTYSDDDLFCFNDGTALVFAGSFSGEAPTVVVPQYLTQGQTIPNQGQNKWTYPIIGVLAGLVVILGFLAFYKLSSSEKTVETAAVKESPGKETPTPVSFTAPTPVTAPQPARPPVVNSGAAAGRFPEGSARLLTSGDLYGKTSWDLRIMRNEIFARYGYVFKNSELRSYFLNQPWYRPQFDNVENFLTPVEKRNVVFLKSYE